MKRIELILLIIGIAIICFIIFWIGQYPVEAATRCRDAKTGQLVSHAYAKKYPGLTTCERVR